MGSVKAKVKAKNGIKSLDKGKVLQEKAKKPETKASASTVQASYDLDQFRQQSLHGELKYERKKKE